MITKPSARMQVALQRLHDLECSIRAGRHRYHNVSSLHAEWSSENDGRIPANAGIAKRLTTIRSQLKPLGRI
jgi:hypothetical protein